MVKVVLAITVFSMTLATGLRMAPPAGLALKIVASLILLVAGITLLLLVPHPSDRVLALVALGNTSVAFVLAFWTLAGWGRFSRSGRLIAGITVVALLLFALGELAGTLREEPPTPART